MENISSVERKKRLDLVEALFKRLLPILLAIIFIVRLFSYQTRFQGSSLDSLTNLNCLTISPFVTFMSLLAVWLQVACNVIIILRGFKSFKVLRNICRFITLPCYLLNIVLIGDISYVLSASTDFNALMLCLVLECIIGIALSIYDIYIDRKEKNNVKEVFKFIGLFLLMLIPALPTYFVQMVFGYANPIFSFKGITPAHRILLYLAVIIPVALYFSLRDKEKEVIEFGLIYISCTVLVGFMEGYDYTSILQPWSWPFHLCNTALFIIPLCLIFRLKRLFYFTYFINVLGAALAMLMPNYSDSTNILAMRVFTFWYNHWIAFFMPLLIVALKYFERPKLKQFIWSMVWFLGYFIVALVFNVVFTAMEHEVDYFFINSNFVGDKLGNWADKLFNITASFNVGTYEFTFHPLYQTIFFLTYIVLGLGMWFVYAEFFRVADNHYKLQVKLHEITQYEYAKSSIPSKERRKELMDLNLVPCLELKHFSKKYASSKHYAVKDASLKVEAGEIFGFLGPNGAGKSTIIKSIVGIQTITEGSIEICGLDFKADSEACKYNIGYVPDHYALYEKLTGREYINYIADIYEVTEEDRNERLTKYLKIFEMENSIDSKIQTYSHGMKQKITIMAALVHNPKVWILDEPLTGLDPNSIYQVKECMKAHAAEGNIVFFSSHLIDIVEKLCERIAIIKHGEIKCIKSVKEIEDSGVSLEQFYLDIIGDNSHDPRLDDEVEKDK